MVSHCNGSEYTAYAWLGGRETATVVRFIGGSVCVIMQPNFMGLGGHTTPFAYINHS